MRLMLRQLGQMDLKCFFIGCLLLASMHSIGQQELPELDEYGVPIEYEEDEILVDTTLSNGPKRNTLKTLFKGRPGRAALYSLVFPGGGQIYNKKWWKLPLVYGLEGAAIYNVYASTNQYKKLDRIFKALSNGETVEGYEHFTASTIKTHRDNVRQRREYSWVYATLAHLVTVFDAFVDRHLIEFDIEEDLNVYIPKGTLSQPYVGVTFKYSLY